MEKQKNYNMVDFDYDFERSFRKEEFSSSTKNNEDILNENSTESLYKDINGLKPIREIIRGSVIYEQNGDNN